MRDRRTFRSTEFKKASITLQDKFKTNTKVPLSLGINIKFFA
ncbi:hypothetical protein FDUTEX481_05196 [Tolypothrix sp. PCC 7601]|nr:hypothetical protein FDUTEX481_05196 [Tolypothrix sp. PCC 7601]